MSGPERSNLTPYDAATYVIRVRGNLRGAWSERLGGMQISPDVRGSNRTVLIGTLADQAALLSVLNGLYDLGLPILLVEWIDLDEPISQGVRR